MRLLSADALTRGFGELAAVRIGLAAAAGGGNVSSIDPVRRSRP
jgi:hypothetical protein